MFARGSRVTAGGASRGCAWADCDNDGFLDLFVGNGSVAGVRDNFLYRNNGNKNAWLKVRCVGTHSNRVALGAKVRVKATIADRTFWQLRGIFGGSAATNEGDPRPNFGLGDATIAETVRIEWPSGIVQELHNVPANQILTVTEPAKFELRVTRANSLVELKLKSWEGFVYDIEASNDLRAWTRVATLTNETGTVSFADSSLGEVRHRFYRPAKP